jgi:threonine dehydrogenase-like Zn-dependent dehydrogenase
VRALWLEAGVLRARDDVPPPPVPAGEARVRVRLAGICGTDLELVRGYYPFTGVPGHEFVGVVDDAPGAAEWIGRRVVGEINASCRTCATCRAGRPTHCPARTVLGIRGRAGAFAEWLALPVANLHAVPDAIADDDAVFTEPLAAALEIQEQVALDPGTRVVVVGAGRLGQLIARTLALVGCDLVVVTRRPEVDALLARAGIRTAAAPALPDDTADVVVECTGNADGLGLARRLVRPRGTIVLKSTYAGDTRLDVSSIVVDEVTLVGSRCGPFARALDVLARGALDLEPLRHARRALGDGVAAFAEAAEPGRLKVLLEC